MRVNVTDGVMKMQGEDAAREKREKKEQSAVEEETERQTDPSFVGSKHLEREGRIASKKCLLWQLLHDIIAERLPAGPQPRVKRGRRRRCGGAPSPHSPSCCWQSSPS